MASLEDDDPKLEMLRSMLEMSADVHDGTVEDEDDTEVADSPTIEENDVCTPLTEQARAPPRMPLALFRSAETGRTRTAIERQAVVWRRSACRLRQLRIGTPCSR